MTAAVQHQNGNGSKLFDAQAERVVAFSVLAFPDEAPKYLSELSPIHFADPLARHALSAFMALQESGKPINGRLAAEWLSKNGLIDECGGVGPFLVECQQAGFNAPPAVARHLYPKVVDRSRARRVHAASQRAIKSLENGDETTAVTAAIAEEVESIATDAVIGPAIEFLPPSQLRDFDPPFGWNLVGDFHLQRGAVTVIGGAPGIGKSRIAIALAVSGERGEGAQWMGLPVHRQFRTMVLQTENGRVRLKRDFDALNIPELDNFLCVCPPPAYGLRFDRPEFRAQLRRAVRRFKPDVVILDPWNSVAAEDKQKDYMAAFEAIRGVLPTGDDKPALVIVAHTRKPNAQERTSGTGLLNTLAGSYVLGSVPRAAFIVQRASNDTLEKELVWTCAKNNDGEMGPRSAWRRSNGLFEPVPDFDWEGFDDVDNRGKRKIDDAAMESAIPPGIGVPRKEALRRLIEDKGFGKTAAYDALRLDGRFCTRLTENEGVLKWH